MPSDPYDNVKVEFWGHLNYQPIGKSVSVSDEVQVCGVEGRMSALTQDGAGCSKVPWTGHCEALVEVATSMKATQTSRNTEFMINF